jgi:EmrB/QacA subfamily drug resistance transporter
VADDRNQRLLVALVLSSSLAPLNSTMIAVAIPSIARAFEHSAASVTHALVTSYLVVSITLQSAGGKLGDSLGHRRALALGQWTFLAGSLLGVLAPGLVVLVCSRVMMALGGAIIVPNASALLRNELPPEKRGRAFGAFGAAMGLSATLGPLLGGTLDARLGFRSLFLVNVPVLLLAAALARMPRAERAVAAPPTAVPAARFDFTGAFLMLVSLLALVIGSRLKGATRGVVIAGGVLLMVPLVVHELRAENPFLDLKLFRSPALLAGALITALHNLGMYSLLFLLPSVFDALFALNAEGTGHIVIAMMVAMVVVSPLSGRLADRLGARLLAVLGCFLALGGMVLLRVTKLETPSSVILPLVVLGAGIGLAGSPTTAAAMSAAPREQSGMAAGLLSTLRYLGGVAGILLLAVIATSERSVELVTAELHQATHVFIGAFVLAVVAAAFLPARLSQAR